MNVMIRGCADVRMKNVAALGFAAFVIFFHKDVAPMDLIISKFLALKFESPIGAGFCTGKELHKSCILCKS
jgi:hypothetical protein